MMYMIYAVLATIFLIIQLVYLRRLKVMTAYLLLPLLSLCVAYENFSLYLSGGHDISHEISHIYVGYTLNSFIVPLFLLVLYELIFKLHEFRNAHFFCFELEVDSSSLGAQICMWIMRCICIGLTFMTLIVSFGWFNVDNQTPTATGAAGLIYLADYPTSTALWLSLIPSICLSLFGSLVAIYIFKYGTYVALDNNTVWKGSSLTIIFYIVGSFFGPTLFPVTSNGGELILLFGLTLIVYLAQYELSQAASYADFLHRSNRAFKAISLAKADVEKLTSRVIDRVNATERKTGRRTSGTFVADFVRKHRRSQDGSPPKLEELEAGEDSTFEGSDDEAARGDIQGDLTVHGGKRVKSAFMNSAQDSAKADVEAVEVNLSDF